MTEPTDPQTEDLSTPEDDHEQEPVLRNHVLAQRLTGAWRNDKIVTITRITIDSKKGQWRAKLAPDG